jgi:hypothetical protein
MVLLVFAGSAAEFALNRAVDWLFFTGKLPGDPIGRLFTTAGYAQQIVFADEPTAARTLDRIRAAHEAVERQRGQSIPDWAHRDVLYMLIDYSERAHELLARPLGATSSASSTTSSTGSAPACASPTCRAATRSGRSTASATCAGSAARRRHGGAVRAVPQPLGPVALPAAAARPGRARPRARARPAAPEAAAWPRPLLRV